MLSFVNASEKAELNSFLLENTAKAELNAELKLFLATPKSKAAEKALEKEPPEPVFVSEASEEYDPKEPLNEDLNAFLSGERKDPTIKQHQR